MMKRAAIAGIVMLALGASVTAVNAAGTNEVQFIAEPVIQDIPEASQFQDEFLADTDTSFTADDDLTVEQIPGGEASWYGARFAGRSTANGERFDPQQLTAAHRTLPFGSKVRVTHENSGKSVVVRINDRGPFHGDRVIDLSQAAAEQIGIHRAGKGKVALEVLAS